MVGAGGDALHCAAGDGRSTTLENMPWKRGGDRAYKIGSTMNAIAKFSALVAGTLLLAATSLRAADTKGYQVTGQVLEVTATKIVVQKGDDRWELARAKHTKGGADIKVGSKVTVYYTMVADEVETKGDAKTDKKKEK